MKKENQDLSRGTFLTANSKSMFFADPATALAVVSAGLDVALKVKQLFSKDNSKSQIKKQLAEIQRQNTRIISMLTDVLVILNNLGVIIRAGVRDEILVYIKGTLDVNFQRFCETWDAELESPDARREAEIKYKEFFPKFADLGRLFAQGETYGYAHFQTVGHAMSVEMWISRRLKENKAFRRQAAKKYAEYFERVLNPSELNSIAAQLVQTEAQIKRLNAILESADKFVSTNPTIIVDKERLIEKTKQKWTYAEVEGVISGDRNSGYQYTERNKRTWSVAMGDGSPGGPGGRLLDPDPIDTGDTSLAGRADYWNSVRKASIAALQDKVVLEKSQETANIYLDVAKEISTNP